MLDHFGILAPFYERFIPPPDGERWKEMLGLPIAGNLLDAGGGTGRVSGQLRPFLDQLVICDESPKMLAQAREKLLCCTAVSHVETLPFASGSFDRIMVVDALHHFGSQRHAIAELIRVLKPGGRLVIEEPDLHKFNVKMIAIGEKVALMRSKFYTPEAIRDMIAAHGLQTKIETDGRFAAWIIADKP